MAHESTPSIELELATLAHRQWCEKMLAQGWRPGPFDSDKRTHDALVEFNALDEVDRRNTVLGVRVEDLVERIQDLAEYPRGRDREFSVAELCVGLRVASSDEPKLMGTVESWVPDPEWPAALRTITVRWDSGEVNEHVAAERELAR